MPRIDSSAWKTLDCSPVLTGGQAHVWRIALAAATDVEAELAGLLAADERERAARFVFSEHRRRYVACRGRLRQILGNYLGEWPANIDFRYETSEKPMLAGPNSDQLSFNVAHSEDMALIAISCSGSVGVDVEAIRPLTSDLWGLAKVHFSSREQAELRLIDEPDRLRAFFRGWTRKEAIVKADGSGLAAALDKVEVGLGEQAGPTLVEFSSDATVCSLWKVWSHEPQPGFVGAVAAPQTVEAVECYCWV